LLKLVVCIELGREKECVKSWEKKGTEKNTVPCKV